MRAREKVAAAMVASVPACVRRLVIWPAFAPFRACLLGLAVFQIINLGGVPDPGQRSGCWGYIYRKNRENKKARRTGQGGQV